MSEVNKDDELIDFITFYSYPTSFFFKLKNGNLVEIRTSISNNELNKVVIEARKRVSP
jgi:hypothetical protein